MIYANYSGGNLCFHAMIHYCQINLIILFTLNNQIFGYKTSNMQICIDCYAELTFVNFPLFSKVRGNYNSLPDYLKVNVSLNLLKVKLKAYILAKY